MFLFLYYVKVSVMCLLKSILLVSLALFGLSSALGSQPFGSIDESALEEKVLTLEEMVQQHTEAIAINAANIKDLDERVREIETKPLAFAPPQATARTAVKFDMPKLLSNELEEEELAELRERFNSLKQLSEDLDEYKEYENYRSPNDRTVTPQPVPQPVSNGSTGTSYAPMYSTVQYGSVAPVASSLGSGGTSYATAPVASYNVAAPGDRVFTPGPVRQRVRGFLRRTRLFGGPGLANSVPARFQTVQRVQYQQQPSLQYVNTQVANEQKAYYCVDVNGNPVACN